LDRTTGSDVEVVYDGQCPLCSAYVRMLRLRAAAGRVRLIDARGDAAAARGLRRAGIDLDRGMVVRIGGRTYHGSEAMHVLTLMSTRSGIFNRFAGAAFGSRRMSRLLYPPLVAGRNATLRLLGRPPIARD
jgi:predicted DCC family thiol-disulfide oxidoreductase YuxK